MTTYIFIVMKQSKQYSDSPSYIQYVYADENRAKEFVAKARLVDTQNFYYIDDRAIEHRCFKLART